MIASTISSEVDLDIGLVEFVNLDASPKERAVRVQTAGLGVKVSPEARLKTLESHGFSASAGAKRLITVYKTI